MKHGSIFLAGLLGLGSASAALAEEPSWVQADKARGAWQGAQFVYGSGEGAAISRQAYASLVRYVLEQLQKPQSDWRSVVLDTEAMQKVADPACAGKSCSVAKVQFASCAPGAKPAVVFDADETLLLNLGQEYAAIAHNQAFTPARWEQWERESAAHVAPVPGALDALAALAGKVTVLVVTNRDPKAAKPDPKDPKDFSDYTIEALKAAGLGTFLHDGSPKQTIFLKGENGDTSSKKDGRRREILRRNYCVLAMAGDQLGDFSDLLSAMSMRESRPAVQAGEIAGLWGNGWFLLPNAVYGNAVPYPGDIDDVFPLSSHWSATPTP